MQTGDCSIAIKHRQPIPGQAGIRVVTPGDRFGKRVSDSQHRRREAFGGLKLQPVIHRGVEGRVIRDVGNTAELGKESASVIAAAWTGRVNVLVYGLANSPATDVSGLHIDSSSDVALDGGIPALDVSAMEDLREGRRTNSQRQRERSEAQVRSDDRGNAGPQCARSLEAGRSRVLSGDGSRIIVTKITERVGVDADAGAYAHHGFLI